MNCASCDLPAILDTPLLCKEHFLQYFEGKVNETIRSHQLIPAGARVAVAVSGGKDSLTVLALLHTQGYNVTAIAIDEGIAGYREHTLADAKTACDARGIALVIKTYQELAGMTLDEMVAKKQHPCTVCGILRRHLLNIAAREFDVIATGHNADDEAQAVLMNIIKGNTELFPRLGPATGNVSGRFTPRVKPLYFCTEKEVAMYAFLNGLLSQLNECPHAGRSYRGMVRDELNRYTQSHPGVKERILRNFLELKRSAPAQPKSIGECARCGEPASKPLCNACVYMASLKS
jgi:uncharacterized protein (TIGR00269 family)